MDLNALRQCSGALHRACNELLCLDVERWAAEKQEIDADDLHMALLCGARRGHCGTIRKAVMARKAMAGKVADFIDESRLIKDRTFVAEACPIRMKCAALSLAAEGGHLSAVQLLSECGASINDQVAYTSSPVSLALLWVAAGPEHRDDRYSTAEYLLKNGASINSQTKFGETPLWLAVYNGNTAMARLFLEKGADKDARNRDGAAPLNIATSGGHTDCVRLLLEYGANVETRDKQEKTPLMDAARTRRAEIVELLLDNNANVHAMDKSKMSALHWAVYYGDDCENQGYGLTGLKARREQISVIGTLLLEKGATLQPSRYADTPLILAIENDFTELAQLFLENGSQIHATARGNRVLLSFLKRKPECTRELYWNRIAQLQLTNGTENRLGGIKKASPNVVGTLETSRWQKSLPPFKQ